MTEDDTSANMYYARLGGVTTTEMVRLEIEFMELIGFDLHISGDEFNEYKSEVMKLSLK